MVVPKTKSRAEKKKSCKKKRSCRKKKRVVPKNKNRAKKNGRAEKKKRFVPKNKNRAEKKSRARENWRREKETWWEKLGGTNWAPRHLPKHSFLIYFFDVFYVH